MVHDKARRGGRTARRSKTNAVLSLACAAALVAVAWTHREASGPDVIAAPAYRALAAPGPLSADQTPPEGWPLWPAIAPDVRRPDATAPVR